MPAPGRMHSTHSPQATFLHADLDAFYASVEQLLNPALKGKPIAVGGGVVLAASYEAKAFGVSAGMPGWQAKELCPALQFTGGHFKEYQRLGDAVMSVLNDFTPLVERISIDEAFLDVKGAVGLFGPPAAIAQQIKGRVKDEIGLPISIGVATTKHLAKVASQVAKPDGIVVVEAGREEEFLNPLPVGLIWGVGPVTQAKLHAKGITTIGQLAAADKGHLQHLLGAVNGEKLLDLSHNADARRVATSRRAHSVGAQSALGRVYATPEVLRTSLGFLADRVTARLRAAGRAGRTVTVRVRFPGMRSITRSTTLPAGVSTTRTVTEIATGLAQAALHDHPREREITLVAISVSNLTDDATLQLELPLDADRHRPGAALGAARWALDRAMDSARDRFGKAAVGYAGVVLSDLGGVPDEFRELAERDPG
jgi:DNA polymerase-4